MRVVRSSSVVNIKMTNEKKNITRGHTKSNRTAKICTHEFLRTYQCEGEGVVVCIF